MNVVSLPKRTKAKTQQLIVDLFWDYQRLTQSGQASLDKLANLWGVPTEKEMEEMTIIFWQNRMYNPTIKMAEA